MMDACVSHPSECADISCRECFKRICELCVHSSGRRLCTDCGQKRRRARLAKLAALAALAVALVAGAVYRVASEAERAPYGEHADRVMTLKNQLQKEPCDAAAAVELADLLIDAGVSREVAPLSKAFTARCGRQERLLWKEYVAAKETGNWERAIAVTTDLIEHDPANKDYWWWRGIVYEQRDELAKALADFKQTLAIQPDVTSIPFNVVDIYERMKRPCDAALTIEQYLHWHPRSPADQDLGRQRLYREGRCAEAARGTAEIRFPPESRSIVASATVNGKRGQFIIDTGASLVVLSAAFAARAGVPAPAGPPLRVGTANGIALAHLTRIDSLALQGVTADGIEAAVLDDLPGGIDGLLGLAFLARFDFHLDAEQGRLSLAARRR